MRSKRIATRTLRTRPPVIAWACLVLLVAYLLVPVLHSWGVADCAGVCDERGMADAGCSAWSGDHFHKQRHDESASVEDDRDTGDGNAHDAAPDEHTHPQGPHDESSCHVCLTLCLTYGGATAFVEPLLVVFDHQVFDAFEAGSDVVSSGAATHVRTSRGPPII